ncbi:MAG: 4-hydroxy-3-methylbut-2-enyl diphosphate reductase [Pseudomonadota bacterium]
MADTLVNTPAETRRPLLIQLAAPRGFCAGVDRAIQIVEEAITKWGPPVYVRHEIVHNAHVVSRLEDLGAIFVEELDECPDDRPVVFSAHGVPKAVPAEASRREMIYVDATCPLVSKVHVEATRHHANGDEMVLIGHAGHPEVIGTMGQVPDGSMTLIETVEDAKAYEPRDPDNLTFLTQTTLSVDDTKEIVRTLQERFPSIKAPHKEDICYATTNRQEAVKVMGAADLVLVIGAETSSNSKRLVEVALREGAGDSRLVASVDNVDWSWFRNVHTLGITAGASAPEDLVQDLINACRERFDVTVEEINHTEENVRFKLPRILAD